MSDPILVLCTAPDSATGATLARGLVSSKLAACVNLVPGIQSFYVWKGETCEDSEVQLLIKTSKERWGALHMWIDEHHPYEVPELIALPIERGSDAYLSWLGEQLS